MIMGLPLRCRYWSVLQMVATAICYRGRVSSEMAQGCVGSQLSLICEEMKVIQITTVVLGDSNCIWPLSCCIKDSNCIYNASANHTMDVHGSCDGQSNCTVDVLKEKISCGHLGFWSNNDFERITYDCIDDPRKMVQGCVESRLTLRCPEMKVIQITAVVLGDSNCRGRSCCIRDNDCTHNANENHRTDVHRRCDNKHNCTVDVLKETIPCHYLSWSNNAFERITYNCTDDPRNYEESTVDNRNPYSESADKSRKESTRNPDNSDYLTSTDGRLTNLNNNIEAATKALTVERVIFCLIILLAIVILVVVMYRRKMREHVISPDAAKTTDLETDRKEAFDMNEALGTNLYENAGPKFPICSNNSSKEAETSLNSGAKNFETTMSDYCEIEGAATGRIQCDSEYAQLDHGRNYEPLVVYEELKEISAIKQSF